MVSLPPYINSIIVGLMLSDGHLQKGKFNKNARLRFGQSIKHVSFALWVYSILAHYCQSLPYLFTSPPPVDYGVAYPEGMFEWNSLLYSLPSNSNLSLFDTLAFSLVFK
jgi:hypothetical protein